MRIVLFLVAAAGISLMSAGSSQAFDGPWCLRGERGAGGVVDDCQYPSFAACSRDLYLYGNTSHCLPNGNFRGYPYPQRKKRKF